MKELPQPQIDFAISVRDSWYRSNLAQSDFIVVDMSDRAPLMNDMIQDVIDRCNGAQLVFLSHEKNIGDLTRSSTNKPLFWLPKNANYLEKLITFLKTTPRNKSHSGTEPHFALPEIEANAPYLLPTIHAAFDPTLILNNRLQIVATNEAFLKQFQLMSSSVLGKSCCEVLGRYFDTCESFSTNCFIHEVIRTGNFAQAVKQKDAQADKFAVRASPIRNQQNEIEYVVLTIQTTELAGHEAGQPLFNKSLLEQLLSGLSDGVLFCNAEHRIIFSNLAAETIIGKRKTELLNRSVLELPLGEGIRWLDDGLNNIKAGIRFNSIAFNTFISNQKVQVRFAPIFGLGDCYLGGFLYLTEVEEFLPIETNQIVPLLSEDDFEVLHLPSPRVIAEG